MLCEGFRTQQELNQGLRVELDEALDALRELYYDQQGPLTEAMKVAQEVLEKHGK